MDGFFQGKCPLLNWDENWWHPHDSGNLMKPPHHDTQMFIWLVVWKIFYFSIILGIIIPTDELIFFRGVGLNQQPVIFLKDV